MNSENDEHELQKKANRFLAADDSDLEAVHMNADSTIFGSCQTNLDSCVNGDDNIDSDIVCAKMRNKVCVKMNAGLNQNQILINQTVTGRGHQLQTSILKSF